MIKYILIPLILFGCKQPYKVQVPYECDYTSPQENQWANRVLVFDSNKNYAIHCYENWTDQYLYLDAGSGYILTGKSRDGKISIFKDSCQAKGLLKLYDEQMNEWDKEKFHPINK